MSATSSTNAYRTRTSFAGKPSPSVPSRKVSSMSADHSPHQHNHHHHHHDFQKDSGVTADTADRARLLALGTHGSLHGLYGEILPVMKDFFNHCASSPETSTQSLQATGDGDSRNIVHSQSVYAPTNGMTTCTTPNKLANQKQTEIASTYLRRFPEDDVVMTFVQDVMDGISLNEKAKYMTSFVLYIILVGSQRIQKALRILPPPPLPPPPPPVANSPSSPFSLSTAANLGDYNGRDYWKRTGGLGNNGHDDQHDLIMRMTNNDGHGTSTHAGYPHDRHQYTEHHQPQHPIPSNSIHLMQRHPLTYMSQQHDQQQAQPTFGPSKNSNIRENNENRRNALDSSLILRKQQYEPVMQAVEFVVDFFTIDRASGLLRLKQDWALKRQRKSRAHFVERIHSLLEALYLRFLLPGRESRDVIFQHLHIINYNHHSGNSKTTGGSDSSDGIDGMPSHNQGVLSSHSGNSIPPNTTPAKTTTASTATTDDPMTDGVLLHFYVLKHVALQKICRILNEEDERYDEGRIIQRFQKAQKIMDQFTTADFPNVYRALSEWT